MSANVEQREDFAVGISSRVPWDEYRAIEATSVSRLKELARSPLHYLHRLDHPRKTAPLQLGTAAHTATLEPERFDSQFAIWTRRSEKTGKLCPRNGQYYDAFEREHMGKTIITQDEAELALSIAVAVREHAVAAAYLAQGDPEVTMQWIDHGRRKKGRVDWLTEQDGRPVLVGLKTSRDCRHFKFGYQAAQLEYPMQWAWYEEGYRAIRGVEPKVVEIVVESEPPHAVAVYTITADIIAQGRDEYERLLKQLEECEATGYFPGPHEVEEELTLPSWYYPQLETLDDVGGLGLE